MEVQTLSKFVSVIKEMNHRVSEAKEAAGLTRPACKVQSIGLSPRVRDRITIARWLNPRRQTGLTAGRVSEGEATDLGW